jgi:hypothetical protein
MYHVYSFSMGKPEANQARQTRVDTSAFLVTNTYDELAHASRPKHYASPLGAEDNRAELGVMEAALVMAKEKGWGTKDGASLNGLVLHPEIPATAVVLKQLRDHPESVKGHDKLKDLLKHWSIQFGPSEPRMRKHLDAAPSTIEI